MDFSVEAIIQASLLSLSLSLDALAASFAYGCSGTRIPFKSVVVIDLVCTAVLGSALFAGSYAGRFVPKGVGVFICFSVLLFIGVIKLFQSFRSKSAKAKQEISPKGGLCPTEGRILTSANNVENRGSQTKTLKMWQAAAVAVALSLDGLAAGFGAALGGVNPVIMLAVSLAAHMLAVPSGAKLGERLSKKTKFNVSWLGGAVIITLAFSKLL